jgi:hypothetical protein
MIVCCADYLMTLRALIVIPVNQDGLVEGGEGAPLTCRAANPSARHSSDVPVHVARVHTTEIADPVIASAASAGR